MIKKILLGSLGLLVAMVALVVFLFYARGPFVGFAGSKTADGALAVSEGGIKVTGWNGYIDAAEQKSGHEHQRCEAVAGG